MLLIVGKFARDARIAKGRQRAASREFTRGRYYLNALFLVLNLIAFPGIGYARCNGQAAGPLGKDSKFYYASTCFKILPHRVKIEQRVCSVSKSTLVFFWSKLNWASGSDGVEYGSCLIWENYYSGALRIGGSRISTNVSSPYDTEVYLPDLKDENQVYYQSIEGGGPRIDGGPKVPFRFEISYAPNRDKTSVQIRATMIGDKPVFFLVLPRAVKSPDDLKTFLDADYLNKIGPLVKFGNKPLIQRTKASDYVLAEFLKNNDVANRGTIDVESQDAISASLELRVHGVLSSVVGGVAICLGQEGRLATCFGLQGS